MFSGKGRVVNVHVPGENKTQIFTRNSNDVYMYLSISHSPRPEGLELC